MLDFRPRLFTILPFAFDFVDFDVWSTSMAAGKEIGLVQSSGRTGHLWLFQLTLFLLCFASSLGVLCFNCRGNEVSIASYLPVQYSLLGE